MLEILNTMDPGDMTKPQLEAYLAQLEGFLIQLDAREPKNENSEAFDDWAQEHEDLEDLIDDVRDALDALA